MQYRFSMEVVKRNTTDRLEFLMKAQQSDVERYSARNNIWAYHESNRCISSSGKKAFSRYKLVYKCTIRIICIACRLDSGSNVSKTMTISFHVKVGCRNIYSRMFQSKNSKNPKLAFWWPFFVYRNNRKSSRKFRKSLQSSERCRCHEEYSWVEKTKQSFYILARKVVGKCKQLLNHISCLISYSLYVLSKFQVF